MRALRRAVYTRCSARSDSAASVASGRGAGTQAASSAALALIVAAEKLIPWSGVAERNPVHRRDYGARNSCLARGSSSRSQAL